jgi:hypothetical protein
VNSNVVTDELHIIELRDQRRQIIQERLRDAPGRLGEPRYAAGVWSAPKPRCMIAEDVFKRVEIVSHDAALP